MVLSRMTPTLRTERMVLAPYTPADEDHFVALLTDEEVCRWMGQTAQPEDVIRSLFRAVFTEIYAKNMFDVWAVWSDGQFIGHAEIKPTGNVDGHEVICAFVREAWGRGLGTELLKCVMDYAFDVLELTEVHGMVNAENTASMALSRKLGFEHVRDVIGDDGTRTHVVTASLKARDFGNAPAPS